MDKRRFFLYLALSIGFYLVWMNIAPRLFPGMFKPPVPAAIDADVAVDQPVLKGDQANAKVEAAVEIPKPEVFARQTITLGADGFGFSDTRAAARRYFAIDGPSVVARVLQQLGKEGVVPQEAHAQAIEKYKLHDVNAGTSGAAGGDA